MTGVDRIRETIFSVFDELNEQLPAGQQLAKTETMVLVGSDGVLDSLGLVNLIALLEQRVERDFHTSINLVDDDLISDASRHFANVATLTRYLASILPDAVDG
jgi:acyl carrier protein